MIGKCSQSERIELWSPLLIGLLYNCSDQLDGTKKMALLLGILSQISILKAEEIDRIFWMVKESGKPITFAPAFQKEAARIPGLELISQLLQ